MDSNIDISALCGIFGRPAGRPWLSYARVRKTYIDPMNVALWVDAVIEETGQQITARMGSLYSGPGSGLYSFPNVDAEVLVAFPSQGVPGPGGEVEPDMTIGVILAVMQEDASPPGQGDDAPAQDTLLLSLAKDHRLIVRPAGAPSSTIVIDTKANTVEVTADSVTVTAKQVTIGDGTGKVTLNGGSAPIARIGDAVIAGGFAGTITAQGGTPNPNLLG
jgi:hypothetical protein